MTAVLRIYEDHTSIVVEMLGAGPGAVAAAIQAAYDSQASAVIAVAASEAAVDAADQVLPAAATVAAVAAEVDVDAQAVEAARVQVAGNAAAVAAATPTVLAARDTVVPLAAQVASQSAQVSLDASAATLAASNALSALSISGSFNTLALAQAAIAGIPEGNTVEVTADPVSASNGMYAKRSGVLVQTSPNTVAGLGVRQTITEGNIRRPRVSSNPLIAWCFRAASRLVPISVDTDGRTSVWQLRIVPGYRRWRFAGIIPLVVHQGMRPWAALWAEKNTGLIDFMPSASLLRRLGAAVNIPVGLFSTVSAAPVLQRLYSADEGWPQVYVFRVDVTTVIVAVAVSDKRWVLFTMTGQSNSVMGGNTDFAVGSRSVTTTAPYPHRALTFVGGPVFASLTPIDAATISDVAMGVETAVGESPITSGMRWTEAKDIAAGLMPPVHLGETHGYAGQKLAEISKGTAPYTNGLMLWAKAMEMAQKYGAPGVWAPAFLMDQGEADRSSTSRATYVALGQTFRADHEADIRAITRQPEPVWWIMAQLAAPPTGIANAWTALSQHDLMLQAPRTTLAFNGYFLQGAYGMSGVHHTPTGHAVRGEYHAKAQRIIRRAIEAATARGDDPWALTTANIKTCLRPDVANITRAGAVITIPLILPADGTAVVLDTTTLPAAANYGFVKTGGTGGAISSVALVGNAIQVTLATAGGATLQYAYAVVDATTTDRSSAWGNFRDDCNEGSIAVPGLKLRNWLICFDAVVA